MVEFFLIITLTTLKVVAFGLLGWAFGFVLALAALLLHIILVNFKELK